MFTTLLKTTAIIAVVAYIAVLVVMYFYQRSLMYFPQQSQITPQEHGLRNFSEVFIESNDGVKLSLWTSQPRGNKPTIIFFHGNTGNLALWLRRFAWLSEHGYGIVALHYRGFGASDNVQPTKTGILNDGDAAMRYALETLKISPSSLVLYGISLGTGVAVEMAHRYSKTHGDVKAIILESPYSSTLEVAKDYYPYLPVGLLYKDNFDNMDKIGTFQSVVFIYHGTDDVIIPIKYGKKLWQQVNQENSEFVEIPHVGHSMPFLDEDISRRLLDFLEKIHNKKPLN